MHQYFRVEQQVQKSIPTSVDDSNIEFLPVYILQQNQKRPKTRYDSLAYYDGPKEFSQFQEIARLILKELILYYNRLETPFVSLSPWTCYMNYRSAGQETQLILNNNEQQFYIEQFYQNKCTKNLKSGLCRYLAPELLIDSFEPTIKSDIFSLGCLLLMLFDNSISNIGWLFKGIYTESEYIQFVRDKLPILQPKYQKFNNLECWDYLKRMCSFNHQDRPSLEEIVQRNLIFQSNEIIELPEFQSNNHYNPWNGNWNGNQFDDLFDVGQPLTDSNSKTQYFLGCSKYSQTDSTIFKDFISHQQYGQLKCFLPEVKIAEKKKIMVSNTCANYVDFEEYESYQEKQEKETLEINIKFNKFQLNTQKQTNKLLFQLIFIRCILEEQHLYLTPNTKYAFKDGYLLIAGPQFVTSNEQETDFIIEQIQKLQTRNKKINEVIQQLISNSISNYQALLIVGEELDEIVVNRDYFINIINRTDVTQSIKDRLSVIQNYYHPKFMKRELNILIRNFMRDNPQFDADYLRQLQQKCN